MANKFNMTMISRAWCPVLLCVAFVVFFGGLHENNGSLTVPASEAQTSGIRGGGDASRANMEMARMRADLRQIVESQRILAAHIEDINNRLENVRRDVQNLQQQTASGDSRRHETVASLTRRVDNLQKALNEEKRARKAAEREIVQTISRELSGLAASGSGSGASSSSARGTYTVSRGDTLSAIAAAFGVKVEALKRLNNIEGDLIREGQKLLIPRE